MADLEAMLEAMRSIQAQERVDFINDLTVGSGAGKRAESSRHFRQLQRIAEGSKPATQEDLENVGIKVVRG